MMMCAVLEISPGAAQPGPVQLFGGALRIAGDVTVTAGARDENAFFNYTDYERDALRGVGVRWPHRAVAVQAGRIPPVFGADGRQAYAADRLLIGSPLAYQYLTSLRPDAVPSDAG